jgi:transcriptional regulator with XRE-family HTH domain
MSRSVNQTFGKCIWDARRAKGLSQRELAALMGIDFVFYSKLENNRAGYPTDQHIQSLVHHLDLDLDGLRSLVGQHCPNCSTTGWDSVVGCCECGLSPDDLS